MTSSHLTCTMLLTALSACSSHPVVVEAPVGPAPILSSVRRDGKLVVYSATYAPAVEQSEYPVHTNYTIATATDKLIERVSNATGSFFSQPATVALPPGEYRVRAQYDRGGFVVIPVVIEPGKTTVIDLDGEAVPQSPDANPDKVRLPDGHVVGWRAATSASPP
jgi:hypothetical protein